jgi:acetyl/propionyl-CoA carboxylase alpha subunit
MDIDERYTRGKIYKIVCKETDEVYYGSTIQELDERINSHKYDKTCVSRQIINRHNYYAEVLEDYSCNNRYELELRERWYMENNDCINKQIPTRTRKEYKKLYKKNNKEKIDKQNKIYREKNKEKFKDYYQQNKDKIKEQHKEPITCPICGKIIRKNGLKRHQRTKKCLAIIE